MVWYPIVSRLHPRLVVNWDGKGCTAVDPNLWREDGPVKASRS